MRGEKGDRGDRGEQGIQGIQGEQGDKGFSPSAKVAQTGEGIAEVTITDESGTTTATLRSITMLDETGNRTDATMTQRAITEAVENVEEKVTTLSQEINIQEKQHTDNILVGTLDYGYQNSNGIFVPDSTKAFFVSDYIEVSKGDVFAVNNIGGQNNVMTIGCFDKNKVCIKELSFVGAINEEKTLEILDEKIAHVRFSGFYGRILSGTCNISCDITKNIPVKKVVSDNKDDIEKLSQEIENLSSSQNPSIFIQDLKRMSWKGGYIRKIDGNIVLSSNTYKYLDFVCVSKGDTIRGIFTSTTDILAIAFYTKDGEFISSESVTGKGTDGEYNYTIANKNVGLMRISCVESALYNTSSYMHLLHSVTTNDAINFVAESIGLYNAKSKAKRNTLTSGQETQLPLNSCKHNRVLSFSANIETFSSIKFGGTYVNYGTTYAIIDSANVEIHQRFNEDAVIGTYPHNLTIGKKICVTWKTKYNNKADLTIISEGGVFNLHDIPFVCSAGYLILHSDGTTLKNIEMSTFYADLSKKTWVFADSYADYWGLFVNSLGHNNWLSNGYPGRNSTTALLELNRCLQVNKPKILLWALGMNDKDSVSSVNADWKSAYDSVVAICQKNCIELVLATIPNTPLNNNRHKNNIIKDSGYRYVDIASSVQDDEESIWYDNMLSSDKIHPSELGTEVIAYKVISDFPEITE